MSGPSTAREALIVETLGEVAALLYRVEAVAATLDAGRLALINASTELAGQVTDFESRMTGITENAKAQAVKHIARRTDEMAGRTLSAHTQAMEAAARTVLRDELGRALQRLVAQQLPPAEKRASPFELWLTYAATAAATFVLTWAAAWLWARL